MGIHGTRTALALSDSISASDSFERPLLQFSEYDQKANADFWSLRPVLVTKRLLEICKALCWIELSLEYTVADTQAETVSQLQVQDWVSGWCVHT